MSDAPKVWISDEDLERKLDYVRNLVKFYGNEVIVVEPEAIGPAVRRIGGHPDLTVVCHEQNGRPAHYEVWKNTT